MTTLRRRIATSGAGTRIPVRVEDAGSGCAVALTVAERDGSYSVEVPGGRYRVCEKWGRNFDVVVPESGGPFDVGTLAGEEATTGVMAGDVAEAQADGEFIDDVAPEPAVEPGESPRELRDGGRVEVAASTRAARVPRDGESERDRGPWTRVRRGGRVPRDGGRNRGVSS